MPSKSVKQHSLMEGIAHGMKPRGKNAPSVEVAQDFVAADKATGNFRGAKRKKMPVKLGKPSLPSVPSFPGKLAQIKS